MNACEGIIALLHAASSFIRRWPRSLALILAVALLMTAWFWKRPISGVGGLPILGRIEIPVTPFFQEDPRWAAEVLGASPCDTLGSAGCAVTSAAMVLASYGVMVDPKALNQYLIAHNGYEGDSWIKWEVAAEYPPGVAEHRYEDLPSYGLIDWNLLCGNPVIVRIRRATGNTHFMVIVGKQGFNYLIRDPAAQGLRGVYPFSQLGAPIEALRFYRKK
ncbi:MAG: C39 family peptidase [Verrucomicrobiota bacterium]